MRRLTRKVGRIIHAILLDRLAYLVLSKYASDTLACEHGPHADQSFTCKAIAPNCVGKDLYYLGTLHLQH